MIDWLITQIEIFLLFCKFFFCGGLSLVVFILIKKFFDSDLMYELNDISLGIAFIFGLLVFLLCWFYLLQFVLLAGLAGVLFYFFGGFILVAFSLLLK